MPVDFQDQFISSIADVIAGWNEKLQLTDDQLALMVPFCDLYAIFKGDDQPIDVGEKNMQESGFQVQLKDYSGKVESVNLVPIFNLLEQQTSVDPSTGKLINPRGIGGILSAKISTYSADLGAYQATLDLEVPSFTENIKNNRALRRLSIPGSDWIIAYGWARDSASKQFSPLITTSDFGPVNNILDLTSAHRGYYRFLKCNLQRFNWSVNTNRIVTGRLDFWSYTKTAGTLATMQVHRKTIKELLSSLSSSLQGHCPPEIKDQLVDDNGDPLPVTIMKKRDVSVPSQGGRQKVSQEEIGYYNLGWVIEACRQAMENPEDPQFWKMTQFDKWIDKKKTKVMTNADATNVGDKDPTPIVCATPAAVPISIEDLDSEIVDLGRNESILWSINRLCVLANRQLLDSAELIVEHAGDGHTIKIRDANDMAWNSANQASAMNIIVSSPNSLVLGIELASRVPIDLSWNFNNWIYTDEGAGVLYDMFKDEASKKSDTDTSLSETAKLIKKFSVATGQNLQKGLDANRLSALKQFLSKDAKDKIPQITQEVLTSQTVPVGLALRNFFKTITVSIHGTAFVPPATLLNVQGIMTGIDGQYQVFQLTDSLSPGSFTTELEALNLFSTPK